MAPVAAVTSCGVLVHRRGDGGREFLFLRVYRNLDLPKGVLEPGEDERAGALRELYEETAIPAEAVRMDPAFRFTAEYVSSRAGQRVQKTLVVFLGELLRAVEIRLTEHHGWTWLAWPAPSGAPPLQQRWIDLLTRATRHLDDAA